MVQIFAYFEHMQIVRKLEPTKNFTSDYPTPSRTATLCLLDGAPDAPVSMVASYHRLDGKETCNMN